jgi:LuxR family transcriptional regulator, maltose regulon positive regulatory protein
VDQPAGVRQSAIRQAQAARDWTLAAELLADHWPGLYLGGQDATVHVLMAGFPVGAPEADAELAAAAAGDELGQGSLAAAGRYLGLAERRAGAVPEGRRGQVQVLVNVSPPKPGDAVTAGQACGDIQSVMSG